MPKDLSPPIYMMNYLTVSSVLQITVIIYNALNWNSRQLGNINATHKNFCAILPEKLILNFNPVLILQIVDLIEKSIISTSTDEDKLQSRVLEYLIILVTVFSPLTIAHKANVCFVYLFKNVSVTFELITIKCLQACSKTWTLTLSKKQSIS